jgi:hypothetical protein
VDATQATGTSEPEKRKEVEVPEAGEPGRIPTDTLAGEHLARAPPKSPLGERATRGNSGRRERGGTKRSGPRRMSQWKSQAEKVVRLPVKQKHQATV